MSAAPPPDIFLSYAREDAEWVRPLAVELERRGWRVFWDQRIPAGKNWRSHIGVRLESARCVIVVWSELSAKSKFVLQEADIGLEREVLVPVLRQPVRPPLGFREVHAADLSSWRPGEASPAFDTFIADLGEVLGPAGSHIEGSDETPAQPEPTSESARGSALPPTAEAAKLPSTPPLATLGPTEPEPEQAAPPPGQPGHWHHGSETC